MRLYLKTTSPKRVVPFNYQENLVGAFHKWLGDNLVHDNLSLYSLSWLSGGRAVKGGLTFNAGAMWFISAPNRKLLMAIINGVEKDPDIAFGMRVKEIIIKPTPKFSNKAYFYLSSPILIKRTHSNKVIQYTFKDKKADQLLTETLTNKMRHAGISGDVNVYFDRSYLGAKTKLVTYKGIKNKANFCPVIVEGSPEAIKFAWNVGIGNSSGIGFGAVK